MNAVPLHLQWQPHPPWMERALCAQTEPDAFFPRKGDPGGRVHIALRICALCLVRAECLEYAMAGADRTSDGHRYGIWGGLTATQREDLARQREQGEAA